MEELYDDHEHIVPSPTGAWGLIMLSPLTTPYYLTTNQSETCAQADHISSNHISSSPSSFLLKCFPATYQWVWSFCTLAALNSLSGTYSTSARSSPQPGVSRLVLPCTSEQTQAPFCNNNTFSVRHFWITTFKIINREGLGLQKKNKIIKIINTLFSTLVFPGYLFLRSTVFFYASFYFIFNASFPFYLLTYQLI